jgi:hypothetical protein
MKIEELIEEGVYTSPLALLSIKDKQLINKINEYLPYSIGIEIECGKSPNFKLERFTNIPDILNVDIDSSEQRFRIPNGLSGLICLYNICNELKVNSELNLGSGHHYHIDMTYTYNLLSKEFIQTNEEWMLTELDTWEYIGTYNHRSIEFNYSHNWMRFQECFKTAEIRIGNMTFDYEVIVKRLIHACKIIRKLNLQLVQKENIVYNKPNFEKLKDTIKYVTYNSKLDYLIAKLASTKQNTVKELTDEEKKQIIKHRVVQIS